MLVSTAAGSVGATVGQIAKITAAVRSASRAGPEKVRLCLEEFGYDAALDYKAPGDFRPPSRGPARRVRTSISTTPRARSATPCCRIWPNRAFVDLRHGIDRELEFRLRWDRAWSGIC